MIRPLVSVPVIKNPNCDNLRARNGRTRLCNRSGECESDHAREKQDCTCDSNSEEALSELIPHGTPPITEPLLEGNVRPVAQSKSFSSEIQLRLRLMF
jgi:hypothetical protein